MHPTKNDLPKKLRAEICDHLNQRLAALLDLQLQAKQAHWNVKGPQFLPLHQLFDDVAGELTGFVDDVAERIVALGGTAEGTVQVVVKKTPLKAYSLDLSQGKDHVDAFTTALAAVGKLIRAGIDEADDLGDADTADLYTGISRALDKKLWFLEAHLQ